MGLPKLRSVQDDAFTRRRVNWRTVMMLCSLTGFTPSSQANMNGEYIIATTDKLAPKFNDDVRPSV